MMDIANSIIILFATFEPLKSVEFPMHTEFEIRMSSKLELKTFWFNLYTYTCIVKNGGCKEEETFACNDDEESSEEPGPYQRLA